MEDKAFLSHLIKTKIRKLQWAITAWDIAIDKFWGKISRLVKVLSHVESKSSTTYTKCFFKSQTEVDFK